MRNLGSIRTNLFEMKPSEHFGLEVIVTFINNVYHDAGLLHDIKISNEDSDEDCNYFCPSLNEIFGIHKNSMRIFLLEINSLKGRTIASFSIMNATND